MHDEGSEQEIYQSVLAQIAAQEDSEKNGGDDSDEASEEKPSRRDALLAASTLQSFISDIHEPFARDLEGILAWFGHQIWLDESKSLKPTGILDYFGPRST
ncbi:hypothetical protein C0991_008513 [Blastosporella zonata]|nr:hypothetical protein C0991_008513 [Blastosporella zonata]